VYVDDNLISGPDVSEMKDELEQIFKGIKGNQIKSELIVEDGIEYGVVDFIGADI
jgi:hypothetical protein